MIKCRTASLGIAPSRMAGTAHTLQLSGALSFRTSAVAKWKVREHGISLPGVRSVAWQRGLRIVSETDRPPNDSRQSRFSASVVAEASDPIQNFLADARYFGHYQYIQNKIYTFKCSSFQQTHKLCNEGESIFIAFKDDSLLLHSFPCLPCLPCTDL